MGAFLEEITWTVCGWGAGKEELGLHFWNLICWHDGLRLCWRLCWAYVDPMIMSCFETSPHLIPDLTQSHVSLDPMNEIFQVPFTKMIHPIALYQMSKKHYENPPNLKLQTSKLFLGSLVQTSKPHTFSALNSAVVFAGGSGPWLHWWPGLGWREDDLGKIVKMMSVWEGVFLV